jgi:hypothetical protein
VNSPSWILLLCVSALAAPADKIPAPTPEACIPFDPDPGEGEMIAPSGLSYAEVKGGLNGVIQHALHCSRPEGFDSVHLTFDLIVGCDGVVKSIETVDDGGAPEPYVTCVSDVIKKADFPAHDFEDGFPVTYPVNVNW